MKLRTIQDINTFKTILSEAAGCVWAEDEGGKRYDLRNELVQYQVIGSMLRDNGSELLLYASDRNDECRLIAFLLELREDAA